MMRSLRGLLVLLVGATFLFNAVAYGATDTRTSVGPQNCATIDSNWKQYSQRIRGANTKVSDVVLNACAAIGGGCQFTSGYRSPAANQRAGGAKQSQHIQANAIDLRVPSGKEVEFMTLAICGLRKVNNCQGGLGYYSSKAIHVDTRTGRTNVWSDNYRRTSIAQNVSDSEAQQLLYGFGDGKCTEGSIEGDYSEEQMYGPPVRYTPPTGFPQILQPTYPAGGYKTLTTQQVANELRQPTLYSTTGGGETLLGDSVLYRLNDDSAENTGFLLKENDTRSVKQTGEQNGPTPTVGADNKAKCAGSGLFGTNLFGTCKERETDTAPETEQITKGPETTFVQNPARDLVGDIPISLRDETVYLYDAELDEPQRVGTVGSSAEIFYAVHDPQDNVRENYETNPQSADLIGTGQFVSGETRPVVREVPTAIRESTRFARLAAQLGAYYGLVHGTSPLVLGSAPRTLVRFIQNGLGTRVYNPFSI